MYSNKEEKSIDTIFEELRKGLKETFQESAKYLEFLKTTSRFKKYSLNNVILLYQQCFLNGREGSYLNTFKGWKDLGYSVNKGQKAMEILMPSVSKYFKNENDKWTSVKKASQEQKKQINKKEIPLKEAISNFFLKKAIFDISQTNCPVEEYKRKINEKVIPKSLEESQNKKIDFLFFALKKYIVEHENFPVNEKKLKEGLKGYASPEEIVLNENNSNLQNLKTLIHEYTHYKLHIQRDSMEMQTYERELEAESVAYIVCNSYDIDTSEYSFKYINMYAQDRTEEQLYKSYEDITLTANSIKEVMSEALGLEMLNCLVAGDIVYANLEYSDNGEDAQRLMYLIDKDGDKFKAFNITSEESNYITGVQLVKDSDNNLKTDSTVKMNVRYAIDKNDIVKKIGTVGEEGIKKIANYASVFENKNLIKDFVSKPSISNNISINNGLEMSLGMKR